MTFMLPVSKMSDGSHEWLMYSRSLLRSRCLSRPIWTVAYVGAGASVHGGKSNLAKRPKGGRATREMLLVVKAASLTMTSWTSGCDGCTQKGVMGAIATGGWGVTDSVVVFLCLKEQQRPSASSSIK